MLNTQLVWFYFYLFFGIFSVAIFLVDFTLKLIWDGWLLNSFGIPLQDLIITKKNIHIIYLYSLKMIKTVT